jgi:hypothetical protein
MTIVGQKMSYFMNKLDQKIHTNYLHIEQTHGQQITNISKEHHNQLEFHIKYS